MACSLIVIAFGVIISISVPYMTPISCSCYVRLWDGCGSAGRLSVVGLTGLGLPLCSYTRCRIQVEGLTTIWDYSTAILWLREGAKAKFNLTSPFRAA